MPDFQFELNVTRKPKRIAWKKLPKLPKQQKHHRKCHPKHERNASRNAPYVKISA